MADKVPALRHSAALPYCYYDQYRNKLVFRVFTSRNCLRLSIIYGDPYDYTKTGTGVAWNHAELPLTIRYDGGETFLGGDLTPRVWRCELAMPQWRRLKYGFRLETDYGEFYASENGIFLFSDTAINMTFNHYFLPYIHRVDAPRDPAWVRNTVWYQIFPERFCNGDPRLSPSPLADWDKSEVRPDSFFGGDIVGIRQRLDYIKALGVNGIYLTPVFQAPSNHKYDIQDYFKVDEHFGTLDDLKALVSEAHNNGIRVMMDAVFNHIGNKHPFWQDVLQNQEQSRYRDYFHIQQFPVKEHPDNHKAMGFDAFAFVPIHPKWNTENPAARQYLLDAAAYWITECDIDAWRLDVANEVSFDFWREFSKRVHDLKPDFYVVGEVWHDASLWINGGYFDATMNYQLGFAIIDFFLKRKIRGVQFTERLYAALARYSELHSAIAFNLLDSHDTARVLSMANGDKRALRAAFTMLFLLPGSPCMFYGTEIGLSGAKEPDCRKPMPWDPVRQDRELLAFFQRLIAFRHEYSELINNASISYEPLSNSAHCWTLRDKTGDDTCRLSVVYTEDSSVRVEDRGTLTFTTDTVLIEEVPPYTVAIFISASA
jgi:neopullulanase